MHDDGYFDERVAAKYDDDVSDLFDPEVLEPVIDFLAELAGTGRALELGIGTGRIALPLAQRGVRVHGVEQRDYALAFGPKDHVWQGGRGRRQARAADRN